MVRSLCPDSLYCAVCRSVCGVVCGAVYGPRTHSTVLCCVQCSVQWTVSFQAQALLCCVRCGVCGQRDGRRLQETRPNDSGMYILLNRNTFPDPDPPSSCHGSALGDDKPRTPATTHATTHATTPTTALSTVAIGRHDRSFKAHSIQDLEALADTELLQDI